MGTHHHDEEELEAQLADLAERGDSDAAFDLALHHQYEHEDPETAARFYLVAAEAGDLNAPNNLAGIHRRAERWEEAETWFRRGIAGGDDVAAVNLAGMLRHLGREEESRGLLEEAAGRGHADAMETLARRSFSAERWEDAERWFRRTVEAEGDERPAAITCVGVLLDMRDEPEEAEPWLRRALDLGDAHAAYHLGLIARRRGDTDEAIRLLRQAVDELGDAESANQLGVTLNERDPQEAAALYERAARDGHVVAARNLGWLLEEHDCDAAIPWFEQAAESGDRYAMTSLGLIRLDAGDAEAAEALWRRAADAGEEVAMRNLGLLHGDRGDRQAEEAWLARAAEAGDEQAAELLAEVPKRYGDEQPARRGLLGRLPRPW